MRKKTFETRFFEQHKFEDGIICSSGFIKTIMFAL